MFNAISPESYICIGYPHLLKLMCVIMMLYTFRNSDKITCGWRVTYCVLEYLPPPSIIIRDATLWSKCFSKYHLIVNIFSGNTPLNYRRVNKSHVKNCLHARYYSVGVLCIIRYYYRYCFLSSPGRL